MSVATARAPASPPVAGRRRAAAATTLFASVEGIGDIGLARAPWAEIEGRGVASPYQSFAFASEWSRTVGVASGLRPFIVVARDASGAVSALLPLARGRRGPLRFATFLGDRLANYHMGIFREGDVWTPDQIRALLRAAAKAARPAIDAYLFVNQPLHWRGVENPLGGLTRAPSPSFAYASALPASFEAWFEARFSNATRKKLRKKARRLEALGPLVHSRAVGAEDTRRVFDAMLAQKRARMRALGLPNAFDAEPVVAFLRNLAQGDPPPLELHCLRAGTQIIATFAGLADARRLSGLSITHDMDPSAAASSPGELLIIEVARDAIARGLAAFDLGVGEARYKSECCETTDVLFDGALAVSAIGRLGALAFFTARRIQGWIKRSPALYRLALRARALATGAAGPERRGPRL